MKKLDNLDILNKKCIIFDLDGTLIDSIGTWNKSDIYLIEKFSPQNITLREDVIQLEREKFLRNNYEEDIYKKYADYLINKYSLNISNKALEKERLKIANYYLRQIKFKDKAPDLIKRLKKLKYLLVLASNTSCKQIDLYNDENKFMREKLILKKTFDLILTSKEVSRKKPHPEIYLKVLSSFSLFPKECLIFEDSLTGIMAAQEAGIEVVNVYDKYSDIDRKAINNLTTYAIDNYEEFIKFLDVTTFQKEKINIKK